MGRYFAKLYPWDEERARVLGSPTRKDVSFSQRPGTPLQELIVLPQSEERVGDNEGKGMAWERCSRSRLARAKALWHEWVRQGDTCAVWGWRRGGRWCEEGGQTEAPRPCGLADPRKGLSRSPAKTGLTREYFKEAHTIKDHSGWHGTLFFFSFANSFIEMQFP